MPQGQTQKCIHCGNGFEPKIDANGRARPAQYCSAKCRVYANRQRRRTTTGASS